LEKRIAGTGEMQAGPGGSKILNHKERKEETAKDAKGIESRTVVGLQFMGA
jgi:hypothetical protein